MRKEDSFSGDGCLVYKITCRETGKVYYGITRKTLSERWSQHKKETRAKRFDTVFYRAIRKYGPENFTIETAYEAVDGREAQVVERSLIAQYGTLAPRGLNSSVGGEAWAGKSLTMETREKISRAKIGVKLSLETRQKMSAARKGKKASPETRRAHVAAMARKEIREKCIAPLARYRQENPENGDKLKKLWTDPEFRARSAARLEALNEKRRIRRDTRLYGPSIAGIRAMIRVLPTDIYPREVA